jgi:predicted component of type VI protein secretion system
VSRKQRSASASAFPRVFDALISAFTRVFDALISAFTRVFDALWAVHRRARTQNRENNPMQSRMDPAARMLLASAAREEKWPVVTAQPDLIPL